MAKVKTINITLEVNIPKIETHKQYIDKKYMGTETLAKEYLKLAEELGERG